MDVKAALDKDAVDTKRNLAAARAESIAIGEFETKELSRIVNKNVEWHCTREKNVFMKK